MTEYDIAEREVVDSWGDGEARNEVQVVQESGTGEWFLRVCYYQDNGRFGQSAPTIDVDAAEETAEAIENMATRLRELKRQERVKRLDRLAQSLGYEQAVEVLKEANKEEGNTPPY